MFVLQLSSAKGPAPCKKVWATGQDTPDHALEFCRRQADVKNQFGQSHRHRIRLGRQGCLVSARALLAPWQERPRFQ
jgi:hypothetical protein